MQLRMAAVWQQSLKETSEVRLPIQMGEMSCIYCGSGLQVKPLEDSSQQENR